MNTKECIIWLRDAEKAAELKKWRIDDIVTLLQQGEKYRQMWEEFRDRYGRYSIYTGSGTDKNNSYLMQKIEKKYFPKEK